VTARTALLVLGLAAVVVLYTFRLSDAPIYLVRDEVRFGLQADSIARTGRALGGERLPLYFPEPGFEAGRDPIIIYMTAAVLRVIPLSEFAVRLPTALVGVLDVVLVFAVASRLFRSDSTALFSALCLALAPAHFIHSRMALDVIYPLPFVLVWLWCIAEFFESGRTPALVAGMLALGAGVYSYLAALLLMPLYFLFSCVALYLRRQPRRLYGIAAIAFAAPLIPLLVWQLLHPTRFADLISAYRLFDTASGQHLEGVRRLGGGASLGARLDAYWSFFNPAFLFFTGDSSLVNSTRLVGVLLTPAIVWLAVGARRAAGCEAGDAGRLLLWGVVTAPAAIVLMGALEIRRAMVLLPFAALLAGLGADRLLHARRRIVQAAALALIVVALAQFGRFFRDYFGSYRERSAYWFGGNLRGALTAAIDGNPVGSPKPVFLSARIPLALDYWMFYTRARGRADLVDCASVADAAAIEGGAASAPGGALFVSPVSSPQVAALSASASWLRISTALEPNGTPAFAVFEKR
jgi:4-amino-4-deoxy-L-arabinose transferase-like glycosyltransferase